MCTYSNLKSYSTQIVIIEVKDFYFFLLNILQELKKEKHTNITCILKYLIRHIKISLFCITLVFFFMEIENRGAQEWNRTEVVYIIYTA